MERNTQPPSVRAQSGSSDYALQRGGEGKSIFDLWKAAVKNIREPLVKAILDDQTHAVPLHIKSLRRELPT